MIESLFTDKGSEESAVRDWTMSDAVRESPESLRFDSNVRINVLLLGTLPVGLEGVEAATTVELLMTWERPRDKSCAVE